MSVKIFIASHCGPCQDIKRLVENGMVEADIPLDEIELIDIEDDADFQIAVNENVDKIPMARDENGSECSISFGDNSVLLRCRKQDAEL